MSARLLGASGPVHQGPVVGVAAPLVVIRSA